MEQQSVQEIIKATHRPRQAAAWALGFLALFLLVSTITELKGLRYIGSGVSASNTISVSGEGEVFAVPDTATFSVTVLEKAKEVKDAQDAATKKVNDIIAYLKQGGIEEKDIKTTDYNINPDYEWKQSACPQGVFCPPGNQVLVGFQVSQTLSVKVRDTKKAGDLLSGVGSRGATQVSGLSFTIDDEDALKAQARDKAIAEAKEKAKALAKSLGVSLVRVVGFSESGAGGPIYYAKAAMSLGRGGAEDASVAPEIPVGENKIVSNVNIVYEIR
ncbi:MAG: SIMPL domain-containing protein [bacterium]|nr:SIMPL domain-containing protein [bacterium]